MNFNFDREIDRRGTNCIKYDFAKERHVPEDVLPLWVADMDLQTAPCINERLAEMVRHGIYGYTEAKDDYYDAVIGWYGARFGWEIERRWIVKTPGVVYALAQCVLAFTKPGDGVLIQRPVYYPFTEVIVDNGRELVNSPLRLADGRYEIDFDDLERKLAREDVKMMILCSPHNPVGRVWTREELVRLEEAALRHGVIVVSDEIHSDFTWEGRRHFPLPGIDPRYRENVIVCTAPSKSFNLAGLQCSNIIIPNEKLRGAFRRAIASSGYSQLNMMGLAACQAAYEGGGEWLDSAKAYIYQNIRFMEDHIRENIPRIKMFHPEGTYLVWLDCRDLGLDEAGQREFIQKEAKLWLDTGTMFGLEGAGFERVNAACTRRTLAQAMTQLKDAVDRLA